MKVKKVLILGVNGFIGYYLLKCIFEIIDWEVFGMDMQIDWLGDFVNYEWMYFFEGDIMINKEWVEYYVKKCDVILLFVVIVMLVIYVQQLLCVFEFDFEVNLLIVCLVVKYGKYFVFLLIFEVYGMCLDEQFDLDVLVFIYGLINKLCWIYVCLKQLMDCVIWGYGMEGLNFMLFCLFNWIGLGFDLIYMLKEGSLCVVMQFFGYIVCGENISFVDGGLQKCVFIDIGDGISVLMKIIENKDGVVLGKIYNIGNLKNNFLVCEFVYKMFELVVEFFEYVDLVKQVKFVEMMFGVYYGNGYQDVQNCVLKIDNMMQEFGWVLQVMFDDVLCNIFEVYCGYVVDVCVFVEQ